MRSLKHLARTQKNSNKVLGGKKSKHEGKKFENELVTACVLNNISCVQIPMGCRPVKSYNGIKLIPQKSDFDFVLASNKCAVFIDTKSTNDTTFKHSEITPHQVKKLLDLERQGFLAGYLVKYRAHENRIVFYKASELNALKKGESLKVDDGIQLGSDLKNSIVWIMKGV